jgi:hypothetical protein
VNCGGCGRDNKPNRRYCGGCGYNLEPICKRCSFVNDSGDRFCGGCGERLGASTGGTTVQPPPARRTAPALAVSFAKVANDESLSADELAELLAPAAATDVVALPDGAIGQDDLDKLFGGAS